MTAYDDESPWHRKVLAGLGALVAASLLVGGVMGAVALGATQLMGLQSSGGGPAQKPTLFIPSDPPSTAPEADPDPTGSATSPTPSPSSSPSEPEKSPTKEPRRITLQAFPEQVAPGERINLTGTYRGGEGATLQVQRRVGGSWAPFADVTATVRGRTYTTWVITSQTGPQRFRVLDTDNGRTSNVARVRVGG